MRSIVLVGIKHCGKSTLGKGLAKSLKYPFIDSDAELEKTFFLDSGSRCSTREIFKILGEEKFREFEARVIRSLISPEPRIIALGGGAVDNPFLSDENLHQLGFILWLDTADEIAYKRVLKNGLPPFLAEAEDPALQFTLINNKRRLSFARTADAVFKIDIELEKSAAVTGLLALLEGKIS